MNMFHRKMRVSDDFGVSKVVASTKDKKGDKEHGKPPKQFEEVKLRAFLNEDDS